MPRRGDIIRLDFERSKRDEEVKAKNDLQVAEFLIQCVNDGTMTAVDVRRRIYESWTRRHYPTASSGGVDRPVAL